jgi:putative oxidoreductase
MTTMSRPFALARTGYGLLVRGASSLQSPLLLVVRLYWGYQFFLSGKGKLADLGPVTEFFGGLGIPFPGFNAALAGTTECVGGLLLLVGFASRLVSLPLAFTMIVAYATADSDALKAIFSEPDKFFEAAPFLFLFASILVLVFGPGKFSIDALIARKAAPSSSAPANFVAGEA